MRAPHEERGRCAWLRDRLADAVRAVFGPRRRPPTIQPYLGFATDTALHLHGRVVEDPRLRETDPGASRWGNLRAMIKRYRSRAIPHARVRARCDGRAQDVAADEEGYFELVMERPDGRPASPPRRWLRVELELRVEPELLAPRAVADATVIAVGRALAPPRSARYGVISDVDDTIVKTGISNVLRHVYTVLFNSAHTRTPFPGVHAFYQALERGQGEERANPIFYLSSSPWNVYDVFHEFMRLRAIPEGPILLKDFGLKKRRLFESGHGEHKSAWIDRLFAAYPDLRWILVGDSGQKDAFIYAEAVLRHPGRVCAVYLRDVGVLKRRETIRPAVETIEMAGVPVVVAEDSAAPAAHAERMGWIGPVDAAGIVGTVHAEGG